MNLDRFVGGHVMLGSSVVKIERVGTWSGNCPCCAPGKHPSIEGVVVDGFHPNSRPTPEPVGTKLGGRFGDEAHLEESIAHGEAMLKRIRKERN